MSDTQYEADTFPAAQVFALWQLWPFSALKMFTILIQETSKQGAQRVPLSPRMREESEIPPSLNNTLYPHNTQTLGEIESEKKEQVEKYPVRWDALTEIWA